QRAGASLAAPGDEDAATLRIISERLGDTSISVDQFGRSQEFTLRYAVIFDLRRDDDTDLVPQQAIELSRDYVSVPTSSARSAGGAFPPACQRGGADPRRVLEAADGVRAAARAQGIAEREVFMIEGNQRDLAWDGFSASLRAPSLFASRRLVEVRLATGKPG